MPVNASVKLKIGTVKLVPSLAQPQTLDALVELGINDKAPKVYRVESVLSTHRFGEPKGQRQLEAELREIEESLVREVGLSKPVALAEDR